MTDNSEKNYIEQKVPFWKNRILLLLIGLPLAAYFIYKLFYPTYSWNEKMTVTVTTPDGDKSAFAVRSVNISSTPQILLQMGSSQVDLKGEAIAIDINNGKWFFVLLGSPVGWAFAAYEEKYPERAGRHFKDVSKWASSLRGKGTIELPNSAYPTFATFKDLNDSTSVIEVNRDNFENVFGQGYYLKSITLEITNANVSFGKIDNLLSWLGEHPEPGLCKATGQSQNIPFCRKIKQGNFIRR